MPTGIQFSLAGIGPYLRIALPVLLVLGAGVGTLLAWRRTPLARRALLWALVATAAFAALDWGLVSALTPLGISFGPLAPALLYPYALRSLVFLPFLGRLTRAERRRPARPAGLFALWGCNLLLLAGVVDVYYVEPFALGVTRLELAAPGLTRPLRVVQLSDLHVERATRRERALIPLVQSLNPDLIVLTGDYLNLANRLDPLAQRDARALLGQLHAPYGVYAVAGTVDYPPEVLHALFDGLDITLLDDEVVHLPTEQGNLYIVGVRNWDRGRDEKARLRDTIAAVPGDGYTLLLYHTPDLAEVAAETGVDLYLAGHTHGGQVRLPFYGALMTFSDYGKRFEMGRYTVGPSTLYVSRGIGMEGFWITPRGRFLCPPEVVVVDLTP